VAVESLFTLSAQISAIEEDMRATQMTSRRRSELFKELDRTQKEITRLMDSAVSADLLQKIVSMHCEIDMRYVDREISSIEAETDVSILEEKIKSLEAEYRLSAEQKAQIRSASCRHSEHLQQPYFQTNLSAFIFQREAPDLDEVSHLFETACFFYKEEFRRALKSLRYLSQSHLLIFHRHMEKLGADPLLPLENSLKTAQALIATAHEISNSPSPYYSKKQIEAMIEELKADVER
jgi:hypothetical protein